MADIKMVQTINGCANDLEFNKIKGTYTVIMHCRKRSNYKTIPGVAIPSSKKRGPEDHPSSCDTDLSHYHDVIEIPETFFYKGSYYTVVGLDRELMVQGTAVTQVSIPGTVERISLCAFFHCINLERVEMKEGIRVIDNLAFSGCPNIHDIVVPGSVVQLCDYAFYKCQNLTTVTLGKELRLLGSGIFNDCPNITTVTCKAEEPPTFMNPLYAFDAHIYEKAVLKVSQFALNKYRNAPVWCQFNKIEPMFVGRPEGDHPHTIKMDLIGD
ncbi:MAG: leucine-rich repeat domain-containing protein [Prevotella sp.]|nr:leucine-rich repeat domain-containing protein [Prevotella sp.]